MNRKTIYLLLFALFIFLLWLSGQKSSQREDWATLYIDNGTERILELNFSNWRSVSAPPGVKKIKIPQGAYDLSFLQRTTQISISDKGDWLLNPNRINHYYSYQVEYAASFIKKSIEKGAFPWKTQDYGVVDFGNPEFIKVHADFILESPPEKIKTSSHTSSTKKTVFARTGSN